MIDFHEFQDLFAAQARMIAGSLYSHGWAICEIRRTPNGKIVGLDPIDPKTIVSVEDGPDGRKYVQRIGYETIQINSDKLMVIGIDELIPHSPLETTS